MKQTPLIKQQPLKPTSRTGTPISHSRNNSGGLLVVEKMAMVPSLKSKFAKNKSSVNFIPTVNFTLQPGTAKSHFPPYLVSPKANSVSTGRSNKQSLRLEEIQPDGWEKAAREITNYIKLMNVNRSKSPQFHINRSGNLNHEVDDSELKMKARFASSQRLRSRDFGSSISTLQNPEEGMGKPIVERLFNEQPMKIVDVRKHDLESYNFKHKAVENESAVHRIPTDFAHQKRDEKALDIPTRKRNLTVNNNMFYKKFYYG